MRQLGARLPELPPVKTDVETPTEIQPHERHPMEAPEPYPVEVHRIERRPIEAAPVEPLPAPEPTTIRVSPQPIARPVAAPPAILEPSPEPAAEAQGPPEPSAEPIAAAPAAAVAETQAEESIAEPVAMTQAPPVLAAAPVIAAPAPPEPVVETVAVTQAPPVPTTERPAATQAATEPVAEPVAAPQAPLEPIAETAVVTQVPPVPSAERPAAKQAGTEPIAEPVVAAPQLPPAPVSPAPATQAPPEPVSPRIRITEAPQNMAEPPFRRPPEPRPESRRELRPIPDVAYEFPEPNLSGRWAEFHDFRRLEPGREGRISLEALPPPPLAPRGLLSADREPEHRSSFLTIAVPGIAAILAVGALLWSGSLRDRVLRQDAQMTALQQQNRKLADALAQMNVDQKVVGALNASGSAPTNAADQPTQNPASQPAEPTQTPTPSGNDSAQVANAGAAAPAPNTVASPGQAASSAGKREGVSVPPSLQSSAQRRGAHPPVDTGYHPEIVPPYPTVSKTQKATPGASSSPPPAQQTDRAPSAVNSSASTAASSTIPMRMQHPSAPAQPSASGTNPAPSYGVGSSPTYSATGNGVYASALAQNIEAVEGLQRQSQVPLREFHARDGVQTKVTPGLFVTVRSPDQAHGTYALMVNGSAGNYQLRGYINGPLGFVDNATHRGYQLVILRIAGEEVYGYIRPVR